MTLRPTLLAALGICAMGSATAHSLPAKGELRYEASHLVLAQARTKDGEEDRSKGPRGRGNDERGRGDQGRQGPENGRGQAGDKGQTSGKGQAQERGQQEKRESNDARRQEERQREDARRQEERQREEARRQEERKREEERSKQREDAARKAKDDANAKREAEQRSREQQQQKQADPRGRDGDRDRDRAGRDRDGRDRDEWRAQMRERMRERDKEKTSAQDLSRIQVREGRSVEIDGGRREFRREGNRIFIRSDDRGRIRSDRDRQRVERLSGGRVQTVIIRPDGSQIITITDSRGSILRRVRRDRGGREYVLIAAPQRPPLMQLDLGPLRINVPRERYFVDSRRASRAQLEMILRAPPVEQIERPYMLEEVRQFDRLRDIMPRVNVSTINFETDSAFISEDQIAALQDLADVMLDIIDENPQETFMVAGHTDATGSHEYNLALSERRAEAVAIALSDYFGVPAENLVTQGYGPDQLLIDTAGPEVQNRRVEIIRLTPLLAGN